jgi:aldehyde reductase
MSHNKTTVKLNSGHEMPLVGLGTFEAKPGEVGNAVKKALEMGYRSIDCAAAYENEAEIGKAMHEVFSQGKIKREDVFITSKLWAAKNDPSEVHAAITKTLKDLQLDHLDLYLIHQPVPVDPNGFKYKKRTGYGLQDLWRAMEKVQKEGLTKSIGVSNYNSALISDIQNYAHVMPAVNQVERYPYFAQLEHIKYCNELGIHVTAYAPLGAPGSYKESNVLEDHVIKELATKHKKTPAQIIIRWNMDSGVIVIPKSVHEERIKENFGVFDFSLSEDEIKKINELDKNKRLFAQDWMGIPLFK